MTYKQARELAIRIQAEGPYCTVPKGHGPDGYFCRIFPGTTTLDLWTWEEWTAYRDERDRKRQEREMEYEKAVQRTRRSPLDILIDRACGIE